MVVTVAPCGSLTDGGRQRHPPGAAPSGGHISRRSRQPSVKSTVGHGRRPSGGVPRDPTVLEVRRPAAGRRSGTLRSTSLGDEKGAAGRTPGRYGPHAAGPDAGLSPPLRPLCCSVALVRAVRWLRRPGRSGGGSWSGRGSMAEVGRAAGRGGGVMSGRSVSTVAFSAVSVPAPAV